MNILAFDTCFDACSTALRLGRDGRTIVRVEAMQRGHAEALPPMINAVMDEAKLRFGELDRIAVTHGPGTFTGTRVGLAAALGLATGLGLPVVAKSSLLCVARSVADILDEQAEAYDGVLVVRDAKRGTLFAEIMGLAGHDGLDPTALDVDALREIIGDRRLVVAGESARSVLGEVDQIGRGGSRWLDAIIAPVPPLIYEPNARALLADAVTAKPADPLRPLYLRPPDAVASRRSVIPRKPPGMRPHE